MHEIQGAGNTWPNPPGSRSAHFPTTDWVREIGDTQLVFRAHCDLCSRALSASTCHRPSHLAAPSGITYSDSSRAARTAKTLATTRKEAVPMKSDTSNRAGAVSETVSLQ